VKLRHALFLIIFLALLASCTNHSSHWISSSDIKPASDANIERIELVDGPILEFGQELGWFDAKKGIIEGITITGWRDTIPLARITRVEIEDQPSGVTSTLTAILLIGLALAVGLGMLLFNSVVPRGGCLILIQVILVSAATMAAVVILIHCNM
jgi:hypothetical protein